MTLIYRKQNNYIWFWLGFPESQCRQQTRKQQQLHLSPFVMNNPWKCSLWHIHSTCCPLPPIPLVQISAFCAPSEFLLPLTNLTRYFRLCSSPLIQTPAKQSLVHSSTYNYILSYAVSFSALYVCFFLRIDCNILNFRYLFKFSSAFPNVVTHITHSN